MAAVAEGLIRGFPAGAEVVGFPFFEFYCGGLVVSYDRFAHGGVG